MSEMLHGSIYPWLLFTKYPISNSKTLSLVLELIAIWNMIHSIRLRIGVVHVINRSANCINRDNGQKDKNWCEYVTYYGGLVLEVYFDVFEE